MFYFLEVCKFEKRLVQMKVYGILKPGSQDLLYYRSVCSSTPLSAVCTV